MKKFRESWENILKTTGGSDVRKNERNFVESLENFFEKLRRVIVGNSGRFICRNFKKLLWKKM